AFWSSHSSLPAQTKPSPQVAIVHAVVQSSVLSALPSSHSSLGPVSPSPQPFTTQPGRHIMPGPIRSSPGSHCSTPSNRWASPHTLSVHIDVHAAELELRGPSSHSSTPAQTTPSLHCAATQVLRHASLSSKF